MTSISHGIAVRPVRQPRRMLRWLTAVGGWLLIALPGNAATAGPIAVEGNRRVEADAIRSHFHAQPDGRLDATALDAGLKELIATGLFETVRIERAGDHIIVRVTEAKVIGRVAFEGNRKIKDADLAGIVQSRPREGLQRATVQSDVVRIMEAYRKVGRNDVGVVPEIIDRGTDRVDLIYTITEGRKVPVRQIRFVGSRAFSERQLRAIIGTSSSSLLSFFTGSDVYDPDKAEADREQIRRYYRNHGYADAAIASPVAEYDPAARSFTLSFTIDEGPLYHFGDISLTSSISGLQPDQLKPAVGIRSGALFDARQMDRSVDALAIEMAKLGYPFAKAEPRITRDAGTRRIDVAFIVDQGQRAYVERIEIHGNSRTADHVIRREFDFGEGDAYNKTLIDRAERRLRNLNYFKTVRIDSRPGSAPDRVVIDVEAIDQSTGDLSFSGGFSTTDGWLGEVKIGDRNFYGTGKSVQAAMTYGQYARSINLSASEPYFRGTRIAAGIELYGRQATASPYQSWGSQLYGGTVSLGTPLTEQASVLWRYSLYDQKVTVSPTASTATVSLPIRQAAAAGSQLVSSIGSTASYNTLDNRRAPRDGISAQLQQDLAGLGGDVRFLRTTQDVRYYKSLNSDLTAMVRAQGGYITGWGGQQVPLLNSFFGGPTMVRGFAANGFGPRDLTAGSTMDNVGGSMYWATTAELQSAIPGIPREYGLTGSVFVDAGSVFRYTGPTQGVQVASKNVVRSSAGVGLTWASPFGALTVDYAVPLSKAAYDVVQPLRFSAGGF